MAKRTIFSETTPLDERVVLTRDRWREIIRFKHPALRGHEEDVRECVRDPDCIRESAKNTTVHLHYRKMESGYVCVVVAGDDVDDRFVVTAYFTKSLKQGNDLWTR
jgi:hypothetical protein